MRKLYLLFTAYYSFLLFNAGLAQPTPVVLKYDGNGKDDRGDAIAVDSSGNIYVAGRSEGTKNGNTDYVTIKYNSDGTQVWAKRYNGTGNAADVVSALVIDGSGNVYVTGSSTAPNGTTDFLTIKYNSLGDTIWTRRFNGPANKSDVPHDMQVDVGGNVYVTGLGDGEQTSLYGASVITVKYSSMGVIAWSTVKPGITTANSLALDGDGNVYITGTSANNSRATIKYNGATGSEMWTQIDPAGNNGRKVLVDGSNNVIVTGWGSKTVKYDPQGNVIWATTYPFTATFEDMALDGAGDVYVTGYNRESTTKDDFRTVKYDGVTGTQIWTARLDGTFHDIDLARSIALDNSGNVYVTGRYVIASGRNGQAGYGTVKYNNAGVQQWVASYGPGDAEAVTTGPTGNVYVTGFYYPKTSSDCVTLIYSSSSPGFTTKHSDVFAENNNEAVFNLQNYPNPFSNNTTIQYQLPHDGKVKLAIYDLAGQEIATLVNENKPPGIYRVNFNADKLSAGTYLCKIQCGELTKTKQLTVLK